MNIFKIKFYTILTFVVVIFSQLNSNGQNDNFINSPAGGILQSDQPRQSLLYFKGSTGTDFGSIIAGYRKIDNMWTRSVGFRDIDGDEILTMANKGIGIGTRTPEATLDVKGFALFGNISRYDVNGVDLSLKYNLIVEKGILTEKVKVAVAGESDWADYVFEEDYGMLPINELEGYVTENKHLPNVPSAEEMVENGLDVAKMDAKLLEKIEEAYLYIIDLNKKVDGLAKENESLKTSLQGLSTSSK